MSRPGRAAALLILPAGLLLAVFLVVPVGYVLALGFNPASDSIGLAPALSLEHFRRALTDRFFLGILGQSIGIAAATTAIAAALGMLLAVSIWRAPAGLRGTLVLIVLAPLLVSIVARTYGWMLILGDRGILNQFLLAAGLIDRPLRILYTPLAILIGLVHVLLPFMALSILAALDRIDPALPEAARTLGAGPLARFTRVILPLSVPGLAAGVTIVFSLAVSAYVTPALMGGGVRAGMLTTLIYQQFIVVYDWHFGAALVGLLLAASLAIVGMTLAASRIGRRRWESPA